MRIIVLGDTHGRAIWKDIVAKETFDKVVFVGDYFDTHDDISVAQQIHNFKEILEYKDQSDKEVILLTGNHDYHYIEGCHEQYSGYNYATKVQASELLKSNTIMCFKVDDIVITHAGVTKTWLTANGIEEGDNIDEAINELFHHKLRAFEFTPGRNYSMYGDDITQSPIWVRPQSLGRDTIRYRQIVGHTTVKEIYNAENRIYLIDVLGTSQEYIVIENGEIIANKL